MKAADELAALRAERAELLAACRMSRSRLTLLEQYEQITEQFGSFAADIAVLDGAIARATELRDRLAGKEAE